jgi:hypothetical protein
MKTNIVLAPNLDPNSPPTVISNFNKYTDGSVAESNIVDCLNSLQDSWVTYKDACPTGYKYIESSSSEQKTGEKTCLNILQWNDSNIGNRYGSNVNCKNLNLNKVKAYLKSLNKYTNESSGKLDNIIADIEL